MKLWQWLFALIFGRLLRRRPAPDPQRETAERIVPAGTPQRSAENLVLVLLSLAALFALGFIVVYGEFSPADMSNALLGICIGVSLVCIGAALTVVAKRLVVTEELEDDYPSEHPEQQHEVVQIVRESGSRITRKRLLVGASAAAGGTLGLAALTPALSLGPVWDTAPLDHTPWRRGVRLVDDAGAPLRAADILHQSYYTAFPEGADKELIGAPLVVIRLDPDKLHLPEGRADWAPQGIMAYSKICTHAGCAVALYRNPKFPAVQPSPALVCPCHYSTFDPFTGGAVTYGPAGRPLPQLPLMIDDTGHLRAAGTFSARVGPSWWNVRERPTQGS
ncbi:MAG TPA: Rieske 2Fe-2S domain-containing protein [Solirubrobacteraceae bacterium]